MNKVILSGKLVKDCEVRTTDSGNNVVSNSIAVKRDFKNANGEYDTDFIKFVAWSGSAEYLAKYSMKGDKVLITGRWQTRKYQAQDGTNRTVNEVVVESVELLTSHDNQEQKKPEPKDEVNEINEDDLPF